MSWQEVRQRLRAPICLTWQITDQCNLRCIHCLADSGRRRPDELNMDEIKDFIDDLAVMKVFYINIGGGEPLLHPQFFPLVDYARQRGIYIQFSTNGLLVDQSMAAAIARRRLRVQVSLDGWNPLTNDAIRGEGAFELAVKAVQLLREQDVVVSVNTVVAGFTIQGLDRMYNLVTGMGARLRLSRLRPSGRAIRRWRELAPSKLAYRALYQWLVRHPDVTTGDSFFFLSVLGEALPGLNYCGAGKLTCSVNPQGDIYPCPFTVAPDLKVGNIREKPLSRWWRESELFTRIGAGQARTCLDCPGYSHCQGGCRGASYLVYGDWNHPDPECMRGEEHGCI